MNNLTDFEFDAGFNLHPINSHAAFFDEGLDLYPRERITDLIDDELVEPLTSSFHSKFDGFHSKFDGLIGHEVCAFHKRGWARPYNAGVDKCGGPLRKVPRTNFMLAQCRRKKYR